MLDPKIAFKNYNSFVRHSEILLQSFPLRKEYFTNSDYTLRKNHFEGVDHWFPYLNIDSKVFYDLLYSNSDTIQNDEGEDAQTNTEIASIYFRLATEKIEHSRQVYRLMDWLGDIGGIGDMLTSCVMFFIGGYL